MNKFFKLAVIMAILTAIALGSCSFFTPGTITTAMLEDVEELQGLLPAFGAAMTLVVPDDPAITDKAVSRTFTPGTGDPNEIPEDYYSNGTPDTDGIVRYPASGYMEDFYGTQGNSAYLYIEPAETLYNVKLYIYPTLSSSVEYVFEEYLVAADSWVPVDDSGVEDYTAYINYETHHFDGLVEDREVIWTRYVDNKYYAAFDVPGDPEDAAYDYPSEIIEPAKLDASSTEYSSYTTGKTLLEGEETGKTFTEFYTETPAGISGISYIKMDYPNGSSELTVRRFSEIEGVKTVRARTVYSDTASSRIVSVNERINITTGSDGKTGYFQENKRLINGTVRMIITLRLTETEAGSNKFTGTHTMILGSRTLPFNVTLDTENGLVIDRDSHTITTFNANKRIPARPVTISLDNGSEFTGSLYNGKLTGTIERGKEKADVVVNGAFRELD